MAPIFIHPKPHIHVIQKKVLSGNIITRIRANKLVILFKFKQHLCEGPGSLAIVKFIPRAQLHLGQPVHGIHCVFL